MQRFKTAIDLVLVATLVAFDLSLSGSANGAEANHVEIDKVFFAQFHVLEASDPTFKLVGDLETLIKVQVYSEMPVPSPYVLAELQLGDNVREIRLRGPKTLPKRPDVDPVLMPHTYDDSFTAIIPREWIRPGLKVAVELRHYDYTRSVDDLDYLNPNPRHEVTVVDRHVVPALLVGAPTKMVMHMFDIHFFGGGMGADYPLGWQAELKAKLPLSELEIRRVRNIVFDQVVIPPGAGGPPARVHDVRELAARAEEFENKAHRKFSHQIGLLGFMWARALKLAGSGSELSRSYCINSAGILSSGRGTGFCTANHLHRRGLLIHELGHAYGLPHWLGRPEYPYQRTMYGRDPGEPARPNAGPKWAFNMNTREFLPAYVTVDGQLEWIHDPMLGGGRSRRTNSIYTHFSDYSIHRMQQQIENAGVCWNPSLGKYARWNQDSAAYDKVVESDGLNLPVARDVEVTSLIFTANGTIPEANIIYPPIGPYKAGMVRLFEADSAADRQAAASLGYAPENGNVALQVSQGRQVKTYLTPVRIDSGDSTRAFNVTAINLPASKGKVVKASLIHCPDLMTQGLTANHKVLAVWPEQD